MIKKTIITLSAIIGIFIPLILSAASSSFPFVSTWILPAPSSVYTFGADIHVTGTWQLPPDWAGNIYVYLDGVQAVSMTGDQYIALSNINKIATTSGSFDFNIGPRADGTHTMQLVFWGGEECAINTVSDSGAPLCAVSEDNFVPNQVYPERTFSVGIPPYPRMIVTPDPEIVFANVPVGTMQDQLFTISNTGGQTLTGSISALADPLYCIPPNCSYSVNAGTSLQVRIRFAPTTVGSYAQMASFSCTGTSLSCAAPAEVRSIKGGAVASAIAPELWVNTNSLNFNPINLGFTRDRTITVANHGGGILNGIMNFSSSEYACVGPCNYSLFSGATTTLTIRFTPAVSGVHNDNATLTGGSGKIVALQSNVNDLPLLSLSPTQWIIPSPPPVNVGDYRTIGVRVRNIGAGLLSGTVTGLPERGFSCVANCTYSNLTPVSADWIVTLRFDPIDGSLATTTAVFTNVVNPANNKPFSMQGQGNINPIATLGGNISTLPFGTVLVGQTKYATTTLTNTGVGVLNGTVSVPAGKFSCVFNCAFAVAAGSSTQIVFAFTPTATAHYVEDVLISTKPLRLDGYGVEPAFRMSFIVTPSFCGSWPQYCLPPDPKTYDVGTTTYGGSGLVQNKTFYLYIQHTGSGGTVNYNLPNTPHFVCTDALWCSGVLSAGVSHSVQYTFVPSAPGDYDEDLVVNYDYNDGTTRDVTLTLKAHSVSAPYLTVSPSGYTWPGLINVGDTGTTVPPFVVGNMGTGTLSGSVAVAPPFYCVSGCIFSGLDNGDTQPVIFNFVPTTSGPASVSAVFSSNGGTLTPLLRGTGNLAPIIDIIPSPYLGFASTNLGTYTDLNILVRNIGLGSLHVTSSVFSSETHFKCVFNCTPVVPAGSSTPMTLRFAPLTTGPLTDFLNISSNAANASVKMLQVGGDGIFAPIIDIRGGDTNFGDVVIGKFKEKTFTVKNLGTVDLGQGIFNVSGQFSCVAPLDLIDGKCHYNLTAGSEVSVTIRFTPSVRGLASGTVSLSGVPLGKFFVTGSGITPSVKFIEK